MSTTLSTFKFDQRLTETIEELKQSTDATSKSEIVRRAIALLKVVQDAKAKGERIVLVTEDGSKEREIVLP
ncbi:hypothetical protein C1924_15285 [Stenotrophomonas sp. ESTM1D_MKCIP4_1]|nr:hypothetical protein C1924_15285 [Stenotrophomonas sp. ESTM1D_MKCIP4_1]